MQECKFPKLERITENYRDPQLFENKETHLRPLFKEIQLHKASDIIIVEGKPILVNIQNRLYAATYRNLTLTEAQWFLTELAGKIALTSINSRKAVNTSYNLFEGAALTDAEINEGKIRVRNAYRVNASGIMNRGVPSFQIVLRTIPSEPILYHKLGLSEELVLMCCPINGLVLIAGVTGSGKSTTLASIIRYILENNTPIRGNIITHEEPIEYTYDSIQSEHSIVVQSQIPENFESFEAANREAMRRKPAGIIVGELRDTETISSAIEAAQTGHPVFGTVHASSIISIVSRLVRKFTEDQSSALYDIISESSMFIAQRLIPDINGKLFAVREYLFLTEAVKDKLKYLEDYKEVNNVILELMKNGSNDPRSTASLTFEKQGELLFQEGRINENGLVYLRGQHEEV